MTPLSNALADEPRGGDPEYVQGTNEHEIWAHFGSGHVVRARRDRVRSYPRLASEAPPTRAFYGVLRRFAPNAASVLDAGCGAGVGTARLTEQFDTVIGIDRDPQAIAFAREYAPRAAFEVQDLGVLSLGVPADALIVCDVLGHVSRPSAALRRLRKRLSDGAATLIAEPAAHPSQQLRSPARRAYSRRTLASLLLSAGFDPAWFLPETGSFVVCAARAAPGPDFEALSLAEEARENGQLEASLAAYARAARSEDRRIRHEALLGDAEVRLMQSDGEGAARAFLAADEGESDDARSLSGLARVSLACGAHGDALALALEAVQRDPTDPAAAHIGAWASDGQGSSNALAAWRIASNLAPDDPRIAADLARTAAASGDYAVGVVAFERVRRYRDALGAAFHITLAWLLFADGRVEDAVIEARMATALEPGEPGLVELWAALRADR